MNSFAGGITTDAKVQFYQRATEAIRRYTGLADGDRVPVYIVMRNVAPRDWGVFGATIDLVALRTPAPDMVPI